MVFINRLSAHSRLRVGLQPVFNINTDRMLIDQPPPQITSNDNQQTTEQRQIQPLRYDLSGSIGQAQHPVKRGKRQQHHRQHRVTPSRDQASYLADQQHIQQPRDAGNPTTDGTDPCQPQTGSGPKGISCEQKCQISCNQTEQCSHREVDKSWVNGVTKDFDLAVNRFHRHNTPLKWLRVALTKLLRQSVAVIWLCSLLLSQTGCTGPYSALDPQGPAAAEVALLWWGMFGFATLVLLAVVVLWHYAIKRRAEQTPVTRTSGWIIWGGLALPTVSITVLLIVGVPIGHRMMPLPDEHALHIQVTGHQWYWQVAYPEHDLQMTDELHIPVNTPVHLHLTSADVIHSFWVPRLGVKLDMLPGRTNVLRLEASAAGVYRGQCAEYCGFGHAHMQFTVTAHEQLDFADWLNEHTSLKQKPQEPDLHGFGLHETSSHESDQPASVQQGEAIDE